MGRFDHLEIGDSGPPKRDVDNKQPGVLDQDYYLDKAHQAFAAESYEQALALYSRTLQYDISMEEAWVGQLRCLVELGELPEAQTWSNRALERFPKSAPILSARAVTEARLGKTAAAMAYSDSAFSGQGIDAYSWIARGDVLLTAGESNASACFLKAIELAPRDWATRAWIARAYLIRKHYPQALDNLALALDLDPSRFTCWYWLGRCNQALGETHKAEGAYRRALAGCASFKPAKDALHELESRGAWSRAIDRFTRLFAGRQTGVE